MAKSIRISRSDACRLMLACTMCMDGLEDESSRQRWMDLHEKLREQIERADKEDIK